MSTPGRRFELLLACVLGAGACSKEGEPATAAEETPEQARKRECERFATEMARTGLVTGQVLVTALDDDPASASKGREEMKSVAQQIRRDLFDKCMQWPEEVMQCLPPLGILKDGCEERLLAAMDGGTPAPESVPPGPALAWSLTLEGAPRHVAVTSDGTVLVVGEALVGLRDGKVAWRKEGDHDGWLVSLPGEPSTWVAGIEDRVVAFDPTDGRERWSATLPAVPDGEAAEEGLEDDEDPEAEAADGFHGKPAKADVQLATWDGEGLVVGDAEARFFRVDPRRCAAGEGDAKRKGKASKAACVTADGRLPDEILESDARLFVLGGERYLWESRVVRAFAKDWTTRMTARAHDSLAHVSVSEGRLVLVVDDEVVELDPAQCRGTAPFAPSEWPQPGVMYVRGSDDCSDCESPPPGCRRSRTFLRDVTGEAPALLHDGAVVVHHDGYTLALHDGKVAWKIGTGGGGPLATDGTRVLAFSTGLREGDAPGVLELDGADGHLRWRTVLPLEVGEFYFSNDVHMALGGTWLALAYEQTVLAIPLPPAT